MQDHAESIVETAARAPAERAITEESDAEQLRETFDTSVETALEGSGGSAFVFERADYERVSAAQRVTASLSQEC